MKIIGCFMILLGLLAGLSARAETWRTTQGEAFEASLAGVYGPLALFSGKQGSRLLSVEYLDDTALQRVAQFLAQPRGASPAWKDSTSKIGKALRGKLQVLRDAKLAAFDPGERPEPEFYVAYFGAHWCPPCRRFSPRLVEAYHRLKERAPDRFEVIYMPRDRDASEMLDYVREAKMPWPVVKFSSAHSIEPIDRWAGKGIPCLVVLTREGDLLFHSYRGEEYLGPDEPLKKFEALLATSQSSSPNARRALHRLAIAQHIVAANSGDLAAKPYAIALDKSRYQTLEAKQLEAALSIDEHGKVKDVAVKPELPAVLKYQFQTDADTWLFLPSIVAGKPTPTKVVLPIVLK